MATVGSLKPLRANSGPLKFVQKQFVTALGDRSGNFKLSWAAQVKTTRDQVDTFEERRTELEKEAGNMLRITTFLLTHYIVQVMISNQKNVGFLEPQVCIFFNNKNYIF